VKRDPVRDAVPFGEAVRTWFGISLQTFGGPAGQIAVMQRVLVEDKRWIGQRRFLHALNYCMLLPGPEAQQLAVYVGWLLNGVRGDLVAGTLFVAPGVVALLALSVVYVAYGTTTAVTAVFAGPDELLNWRFPLEPLCRNDFGHPRVVASDPSGV
jgi:chromate transporter